MITGRQQQIYEVIRAFRKQHGMSPTYEEIRNSLGLSSKDMVSREIQALESAQLITRKPKIARGLRVIEDQQTAMHRPQTVSVPVLSRIAAGRNFRLPDNDSPPFGYDETITVTADIAGHTENLFALEVEGHSMIDALVADGDVVLVEPLRMAENGDMVAVWLRNSEEITLKYFYQEGNRVRLQPANQTMEPWYVAPEDVEVEGRVIAVIRRSI